MKEFLLLTTKVMTESASARLKSDGLKYCERNIHVTLIDQDTVFESLIDSSLKQRLYLWKMAVTKDADERK